MRKIQRISNLKKGYLIPIIILVIHFFINGVNWLIAVPNKPKTEELYTDFVGKTYSGFKTNSSSSFDSNYNYQFNFINKDKVHITKSSKYEYSAYMKELGANDKTYMDKETVPYKIKVTIFGKKYIFIKGFGSDGVDVSDNSKGLPIIDSGNRIEFVYDGAIMESR